MPVSQVVLRHDTIVGRGDRPPRHAPHHGRPHGPLPKLPDVAEFAGAAAVKASSSASSHGLTQALAPGARYRLPVDTDWMHQKLAAQLGRLEQAVARSVRAEMEERRAGGGVVADLRRHEPTVRKILGALDPGLDVPPIGSDDWQRWRDVVVHGIGLVADHDDLAASLAPPFVPWYQGNAAEDAAEARGWIAGHFLPAGTVRSTSAVEVKYGIHPEGDRRAGWARGDHRTTLSLLAKGRFRIDLPEEESVTLAREGDYVVLPQAPGTPGRLWPTRLSSRSAGRPRAARTLESQPRPRATSLPSFSRLTTRNHRQL